MHASETDTLGTAEHRYPIFPYFCLIKTITSPETSPFLELTLVDITKTKVKTAKEPLLSSAKPEFHLVPRTILHHQRCESQTATRPKPKPESPDWLKTVVAQPRRRARRVTSVYATRSVVRWRTTNDTTNFGGDRNHRDRETAGGKSSIPAQAAIEGINRQFHPSLHIATMRCLVALALCATSAAAAAVAHLLDNFVWAGVHRPRRAREAARAPARRAAPARPRSTPRRRPTRLRRR